MLKHELTWTPMTKGTGASRKLSKLSGSTGSSRLCQVKGRSKGMSDSTHVLSKPMLGQNSTSCFSNSTPALVSVCVSCLRQTSRSCLRHGRQDTKPWLPQGVVRSPWQQFMFAAYRAGCTPGNSRQATPSTLLAVSICTDWTSAGLLLALREG